MKISTLLLLFTALLGSLRAADAPAYPLTTCVVSGEKLGEMGKPVVVTHEGTEVHLCCKGCQREFDKDPEAFVSKVKAATPAKP